MLSLICDPPFFADIGPILIVGIGSVPFLVVTEYEWIIRNEQSMIIFFKKSLPEMLTWHLVKLSGVWD